MIPKSLYLILVSFCLLMTSAACSDQPGQRVAPLQDLSAQATCDTPTLKLSDVQSIGSHNSYKRAIPRLEMMALRRGIGEQAGGLDYFHPPLSEQLDLGMRQLELDVFYDPAGGLYNAPYLPGAIPWIGRRYNVPEMDEPGFKVMHIQDVDQRSQCALFTDCLAEIAAWSMANPNHTPILILINAKQDPIDLDEAVKPLAFTSSAFDALDAEIWSELSEDQVITPDDIRGDAPTLREAVTETGWPSYNESRGKLLFALDERPDVVEVYLRGQASLEGHAMFVNSVNETSDHAAYFTLNDPVADADAIQSAIRTGFLVRTRADADTVEARANDVSRREAAFASGAQYISTDYYVPRKKFSDYAVRLPSQHVTRCRP